MWLKEFEESVCASLGKINRMERTDSKTLGEKKKMEGMEKQDSIRKSLEPVCHLSHKQSIC